METVVIQMRVNKSDHEQMRKAASAETRSIMDQYRHAVRVYLDGRGSDDEKAGSETVG